MVKFAGMKLHEAEQQIKKVLQEIYEEQEAAAIAALAIEHITGFSKTERLSKKEES